MDFMTQFLMGFVSIIEWRWDPRSGELKEHNIRSLRERNAVFSYRRLDDLLQYTFDYRYNSESSLNSGTTLQIVPEGMVVRHAMDSSVGRLYLAVPTPPTTEEDIEALNDEARVAMLLGIDKFRDADRQCIRNKIYDLEKKLEALG